jgi:hypothetical protein
MRARWSGRWTLKARSGAGAQTLPRCFFQGGFMQQMMIEPDKWSWFEWTMTILGSVIAAVSSAVIFKKIKKICDKRAKHGS